MDILPFDNDEPPTNMGRGTVGAVEESLFKLLLAKMMMDYQDGAHVRETFEKVIMRMFEVGLG